MKYLFADKPSGITTHTSIGPADQVHPLIDTNDGFVEALSFKTGHKLFVVHRLDRETTGAICFALDKESADSIREKFSSHEVKKTYLFITDRSIKEDRFTVESFIERRGSSFSSEKSITENPANSKTHFEKIDSSDGTILWRARIESGKPHQIRLHAKSSGIPILGDTLYGGSPFPELCLHSSEIEFTLGAETFSYRSPMPRFFENRALLRDQTLCRWIGACERRERLLRSFQQEANEQTTLRWIHSEGDPLRVEQLGTVYHLSWFEDDLPSEKQWTSLHQLLEIMNWKVWYLQLRGDRGRSPLQEKMQLGPVAPPESWNAEESGLRFEFRLSTGLSPGLFLDQRQNRLWVQKHAAQKTVLNLFCYTGGFSVFAAKGGAQKVVSVDVSKVFLEWAKTNFSLNGIALEGHEFRAMDSREYLAWAKKKGLSFDLIICDPPSFSRSKTSLFKIDKDFDSLLLSLMDVVSEKGRILFSSNFEAWDLESFAKRTLNVIAKNKRPFHIERTPSADWDFELPSAKRGSSRNMKSYFLVRQ